MSGPAVARGATDSIVVRMIDLERHGDVFVLRMDAGENRFVPEVIAELARRARSRSRRRPRRRRS